MQALDAAHQLSILLPVPAQFAEPKDTAMKQSQYPELQAILPRLLLASPRRLGAPIFATKEEAEHFLGFLKREDPSSEAVLTPVWRVDHNDLEESQISGWSVRTDIA